ncbi:zinc transport system substrate-binding protein [Constrictibacter sp. MBR-5]|jgi:zinc transport system substrate-binding protein|uniref:zinc ABC transporter substrate-binding protein n=1 Tax=Constrictibacter sp. MBR-5 TaxID=3156467 RepID=UPI0033951866
MRGALGVGLAAALSLAGGMGGALAKPSVVVSVAPVHALVAGVMAGVAEPKLLVSGGASPHTYQLRPSDARALGDADVVVWVGEGLEAFLVKPIEALGQGARSVELSEDADLVLLPNREGGAWEPEDAGGEKHGHKHGHKNGHDHRAHKDHDHGKAAHGGHDHGAEDMHVWLDPGNARRIVRHVAGVLSEVDPENGVAYAANADRAVARIDALDAELRSTLAPVRTAPYIVFHDAYQYLEHHYGLNAVGSVTISADQVPGARRLLEIRRKIADTGARCVFSEPQFSPSLVATVTEGSPARVARLDPLGATLEPGAGLYETLMRGLVASLRTCLDSAG